jgi:GNAT superfamily N-acetyltransferase
MMIDARNYAVEDTLRNGTSITIRAVRSDDRERIARAFRQLEPESVYTRFFGCKKELTAADFARLDAIDFVRQVILVVTTRGSEDKIVIGSGSYVARDADDGTVAAEVAFTVEEDYQGLGIAGRLLRHLVEIARERGITRFEADVLSGNKPMLAVFARSGLPMHPAARR